MSDSISEARERLEKIKYYHEYAGPNGHPQAIFYHNELLKIYKNANKNHAAFINNFVKEANILMDEMKKRWDDYKKNP